MGTIIMNNKLANAIEHLKSTQRKEGIDYVIVGNKLYFFLLSGNYINALKPIMAEATNCYFNNPEVDDTVINRKSLVFEF